MKQFIRNQRSSTVSLFIALTLLAAPAAASDDIAKIPREVIDEAAANGSVPVLVGLDVPWKLESSLSDVDVRAQRTAIASIQGDLLTNLQGRQHKVTRRYLEIPGIALEVGAEALAELARLPIVTNVLLDRSANFAPATPVNMDSQSAAAAATVSAEKVPFDIFKRAAIEGTVQVIAGLRTPWQREELLTDEMITLQRNAIHGAQSYVLKELSGTRYKVMRLYGVIPGIALRVSVEALNVLEKSPAVTNVVLDRPRPPQPPRPQ